MSAHESSRSGYQVIRRARTGVPARDCAPGASGYTRVMFGGPGGGVAGRGAGGGSGWAGRGARRGGAGGPRSLAELSENLSGPGGVWLMVPAGDPTTKMLDGLMPLLARGDIVVDGGNAYYRDSQRRAAELSAPGIHFLDAGVSGGIWGLQ